MADVQLSQGNARDLHAVSVGYTERHSMQVLGITSRSPLTHTASPLSASCASDQHFACSFLQIPDRSGHPCRSATTSPCRVWRGLSPPSHRPTTTRVRTAPVTALRAMPGALQEGAPCRAHKQEARHWAGLRVALSVSVTPCASGSGRDRRGRGQEGPKCRVREPESWK